MYYKVIKDDKVIDVLDNIVYLKYQIKNGIPLNATRQEAQLFLSSNGKNIWHDYSLRRLPKEVTKYETVELVVIDKEEYDKLKHSV